MLNFLKKLISNEKATIVRTVSQDFGPMIFDSSYNFWETTESNIFHSMPGNIEGPNIESVNFIRQKLNLIEKYWKICNKDILSIAHEWDSINKTIPAKELFKISAISVNSIDNNEWEICFETIHQNKWLYIALYFQGEEIVANDIST